MMCWMKYLPIMTETKRTRINETRISMRRPRMERMSVEPSELGSYCFSTWRARAGNMAMIRPSWTSCITSMPNGTVG